LNVSSCGVRGLEANCHSSTRFVVGGLGVSDVVYFLFGSSATLPELVFPPGRKELAVVGCLVEVERIRPFVVSELQTLFETGVCFPANKSSEASLVLLFDHVTLVYRARVCPDSGEGSLHDVLVAQAEVAVVERDLGHLSQGVVHIVEAGHCDVIVRVRSFAEFGGQVPAVSR